MHLSKQAEEQRKKAFVRQLYQVPEAVRSSWSQLETRCRSESQRQTEGFGPSLTHSWATPAQMRKKCCYGHKNLGQYVPVCPHLQLTSHTQETSTLSRIKCERYIFIKKSVRSFLEVVIIVDNVSAHICIFVYICDNTTLGRIIMKIRIGIKNDMVQPTFL